MSGARGGEALWSRAAARFVRARAGTSRSAPPHPSPPPPVYRARDLSASASSVERGALSREVEYAKTTTALYGVVLREAQGVKGDVVALSGAVEALAGSVSGARLVAARLAEVE